MVRNTMLALVTLASLVNLGNTASAQQAAGCAIAPNGQIQGYYSANLKAHFQIRQFFLPAYGHFTAARITSVNFDSPLRNAGLVAGDVITRLDGVQIHNYAELDRHAYDTGVRFIKSGGHHAMTSEIYIPFQSVSNYPNFPSGGESP